MPTCVALTMPSAAAISRSTSRATRERDAPKCLARSLHSALARLWSGRSRLAAIRADLVDLGRNPATIEALPRCAAAADLAATPWRALGSLYVLEG